MRRRFTKTSSSKGPLFARRYVGICGQAPSEYPEVAEFLVELGIDSISLNPDSVISAVQRLVKA